MICPHCHRDTAEPVDLSEHNLLVLLQVAARIAGVSVDQIVGQSRVKRLVKIRHASAAAARELFCLSFPELGELFGGRDHTSMIHAVRSADAVLAGRILVGTRRELSGRNRGPHDAATGAVA